MNVFLDYNSTTPVDQEVLEAALPYLKENFGNASSRSHVWGREAARAVERARQALAEWLGADESELVFTSGSTESVNLALRGLFETYSTRAKRFISCKTEHRAVIDTLGDLESRGAQVSWLACDREGNIDLHELKNEMGDDVLAVVLMRANNETGTLHAVDEIGKLCQEREVFFFCDATQAPGKLRMGFREEGISAACISAHKFGGFKGTGVLYLSRKNPRLSVRAQITGGGHERNRRSGTLNVPGIVAMGKAGELCRSRTWEDAARMSDLRTRLEQSLQFSCGARINGSIKNRLCNTSSLCFEGIEVAKLISLLPDIAMSMGSACSSALDEPSHVLKAMQLTDAEARSTLRISLGRATGTEEIDYAARRIAEMYSRLKK